jgi:predicted helicase
MTKFSEYLGAIRRKLAAGDTTEETHRGALERLLEAVDPSVTATNEPKRIACGAPDFNVTRNKVPVGHIETKDIGVALDEMERGKGPNGEQFGRYREALPNWILTDYLEFRWFVGGEKRLTARLAEIEAQGKLRTIPGAEGKVENLLKLFLTQQVLTVGMARELAARMAGMTRNIRDLIVATFSHGTASDRSWLQNWLTSFREVLIPDLDEPQFADMFAQTLAYGLFAAHVNKPQDKAFSRELAAFSLPKTNPFLRKLFAEFAGVDMPETFAWAVDDIVELLKHAAMDEVLKDFGKGTGKEDPVVHFYETFLTAYDPKMRELRGVYYTPEPVVSYIVRSVDHLLMTRFNRTRGLADEKTLILDPATGTGTFLYFVVRQIHDQVADQKGGWDRYVAEHLLNRVFGFELLVAPYAVAHLKLGMELQTTGYKFGSDQRLGVYLTNTLEDAARKSEQLIAKWISDEANAAAEIKRERPILVVLGNPPYSGHSANRSEIKREVKAGESYTVMVGGPLPEQKAAKVLIAKRNKTIREKTFIGNLVEDYKFLDGAPLRERNSKWLQNDYVKFVRWGQWRILRTGAGILAFITDNSYLDAPTFRGMRRSLMAGFSDVYILNLHGDSKRQERSPDGSDDKNVFDIKQGVTIALFARERGKKAAEKIHYADLWGVRDDPGAGVGKYPWLFQHSVADTQWLEVSPRPPHYLFRPETRESAAEYEAGWKVTEMMPIFKMGITTGVDSFAVAFERETLETRIRDLASKEEDNRWLRAKYSLRDTSSFSLRKARAWASSQSACPSIARIAYRCFDLRYFIDSSSVLARSREDVSGHLKAGYNRALVVFRAIRKPPWRHVFVADAAVAKEYLSALDNCSVVPLYLYPRSSDENGQAFLEVESQHWPPGPGGRRPNLNPALVSEIEQDLGLTFLSDGKGDLRSTVGPEDIFDYTYAAFNSPAYRNRYGEFLQKDFPRLPLTRNRALFADLAEKGEQLVALHLMDSARLSELITTFPEKGSGEVERVTYVDATRRVCINGVQYFEGIPRDVWEFHIGGYRVLEKWLKDRKGRTLTWDDIQHYQKIVVALKETIRLMSDVDAAIDGNGGWPLQSVGHGRLAP